MRILVMNVNTSASMTSLIAQSARAVALPTTEIIAIEPTWGPVSVEGYFDSFISAASILARLQSFEEPFDALVWGGFGEPGHQGAQELLDVPVIDISHAAAHMACLLGRRFGVVTTLERSCSLIEESLSLAGLLGRCASIRATGLGVLDLEEDPKETTRRFIVEANHCVDVGADVIILGCAGMAGIEKQISLQLGVPVIDGVASAVKLAEACVGLGLKTSKVGAFAKPRTKERPGWPPPVVG